MDMRGSDPLLGLFFLAAIIYFAYKRGAISGIILTSGFFIPLYLMRSDDPTTSKLAVWFLFFWMVFGFYTIPPYVDDLFKKIKQK